jgi:H+/Cl- antiporter ClcA
MRPRAQSPVNVIARTPEVHRFCGRYGRGTGLSLGSFRGGPTFPAVFLDATIGVLVGLLPGPGTTAGIAIGMTAATTAVLRLPVTSIVLVVLLLGPEGASQLPVILLAAAVSMVTPVALDGRGLPATPSLGEHQGKT